VQYYIIGDIHGCYQQLIQLEQKIKESEENSDVHFIAVGDLVDRGPDSVKVLQHILQGIEQKKYSAVLGNHDDMFLYILHILRPDILPSYTTFYTARKEDMYTHWLSQGGDATLESFCCSLSSAHTWKMPVDLISSFARLPLLLEFDDIIITHALISPKSFQQLHRQTVIPLNIREEMLWNRTLPSSRIHPNKTHFSGHTVLPRVEVYEELAEVMIDTGCVYGGSLSAYNPLTQTEYSVPYRYS